MASMKKINTLILGCFSLLFITGCAVNEFGALQDLVEKTKSLSSFSNTIQQGAVERKVDLLVIVDNSTSMATDQEKLSTEFANFISHISDSDYRIGVTTTDVDSLAEKESPGFWGNLDVNPETGLRYIQKTDADPNQAFINLIKRKKSIDCKGKPVGCVSFDEKPLVAIRKVIEKRDTVNKGFFREDADLAILIITDEDETNEADGSYYSASDLLDFFHEEFGESKKMVSFAISIEEGDSACLASQAAETNSGAATYGVRVSELSNLTGGFNLNICKADYGSDLSQVSEYVKKNLLPFKLDLPPSIVEDSISVEVYTDQGKPFLVTYTVEGGFLRITPTPPEDSAINVFYEYYDED